MNDATEPEPTVAPDAQYVETDQPGVPMPVSQPVLLKAVRWSLIATALVALVFAGIGYLVSEERGLYGGLLGAAGAGIFLTLTVGSIAFANRFHKSDLFLPLFFGIVLGSWILKLVLFIVAAIMLRGQPWLDPKILFIAVLAGVLISLIIDAVVVMKSRMPIIAGVN